MDSHFFYGILFGIFWVFALWRILRFDISDSAKIWVVVIALAIMGIVFLRCFKIKSGYMDKAGYWHTL